MNGFDVTGWAVEALIASTLLMIAVLLARGPVRRAFGPQVAYALWALPALRLLLPPLPADWREQAAMPITRASEAVTVLIVPARLAPVTRAPAAVVAVEPSLWSSLPWGMIVAAAWVLGAAAFFAFHLVNHRRFCARVLSEAKLVDEVGGIRVIESAAASGPLAFGTGLGKRGRRFVAFPRDFADRYDADERELALAHELGHHARGDLFANWAALGVLALHWFNPVAWRAFRAFRCDQELANDARVLAGRSRTDRHIYACAIVKAAHGGAVSAACHLHTIADLKGRLKMLTNSRVSRTRLMTGAAAVLGLVATGLVATASGTRAAAAVTGTIEAATGVRIVTPPAPPAPPAPAARNVKRVVIVKDGKTRVYEGAEADRYAATHALPIPPIPPVPPVAPQGPVPPVPPVPPVAPVMPEVNISSANCGSGEARAFVITRRQNGRDATVICNDRIAAAARAGALSDSDQQDIQRKAMNAALASLYATRASLAVNGAIPEEGRQEAVAGIDDAIVELKGEIADIGKDKD
ncbi:hypothetical protein KCP91_07445 [Microvirga sp. SRT01]|uniref:Peptidase M56 domain-containing protein n=1 Tax=Sphingomonas longa TaxID=2778730 RepID=A0ABS2D5K1_9SPHN|nr:MULTISPECIES: M56 family metallopeptidase [Alphaproteobacteria]MBM6576201.1 hypothetical protein [Sphingomonas sp. BT552]MBR7709247.1 hypothetical protein [Microvirga sp. SRT01]